MAHAGPDSGFGTEGGVTALQRALLGFAILTLVLLAPGAAAQNDLFIEAEDGVTVGPGALATLRAWSSNNGGAPIQALEDGARALFAQGEEALLAGRLPDAEARFTAVRALNLPYLPEHRRAADYLAVLGNEGGAFIVGRAATVRGGPGTSYVAHATLLPGDAVIVLAYSGDYARAVVGPYRTGFVHRAALRRPD